MSHSKQVFQTKSKLRWYTFQWTSRFIIFLLILTIPIIIISLSRSKKPFLPELADEKSNYKRNENPVNPKALSSKEKSKYKGFESFIQAKNQNAQFVQNDKKKIASTAVRAAFYVDWDPQALTSLKSHINKLNMVIPEWFFIDPKTDSLLVRIDADALKLMKMYKVKIVPIFSNVNITTNNGNFDGKLLDRILTNPAKREKIISQIEQQLTRNGFAGINLDFEEVSENTLPQLYNFQKELYTRLHSKGLLVTQDIMPENEDYNVKELSNYLDYIFLMAYDQHFTSSVPGPISEQRWIEKVVDGLAKNVSSQKIILCIAAYGYDWPHKAQATNVTFPQAISLAKQHYAPIEFSPYTYNCSFSYKDDDSLMHKVYFNDAACNFNTMRFADDYGLAGVAMWRLGAEDERIWTFYNADLRNQSVAKNIGIFETLQTSPIGYEKPDYIGDGEVLDVVTQPNEGKMKITYDPTEFLVSEEKYIQLPTKYVIKRFGKVNKQVILTFDDGPDPVYTPQILDVLKKENVPATFFVVGVMVEDNLPLFNRIYKEGYEIGNHTFTHPNIAEVGLGRAKTEIEATRLIIEAQTGRSTILFRPPFNADAEPTKYVELQPLALSKDNSYYAVGESIDPEDWDIKGGVNADSIYNRIVRLYEANPEKGIILLHDAGGDRQPTVDALPKIIKYFKSKGVQFTTVANLLHLNKDQVMPPIKSRLLVADSWITKFIFILSKFLNIAFWLAVLLGMVRISIMGILSLVNSWTKRKEPLPALGSFNQKISIIVPAYNEEVNCVATVKSLLQQDYSHIEIIFVDDGSKDKTYQKIQQTFSANPKVKVFTKPNGGKASALNFGIAQSEADFLVCIDSDTQLKKDAISQLVRYFANEEVGAVAGNVKVGNTHNVLTKWQSIEYVTAQNFDRRAFDHINGITVVPGAIGAFRKKAVQEAGGFTTDSLAEDCDLTIRIIRAGYIIRNCNEAIAITEAPETIKQFLKQRFRWSYGVMQSFWKNRDACFNPKYKGLGMVSLPNILIFQILMPIIAPLADLLFFISIFYNWQDSESLQQILFYYGLFLLVDLLVAIIAFKFEKENYWRLLWLLPQRFVYRQLMYIVLFRSLRRAIKGDAQGWGNLKRTGNVVVKH